MMWKRLFDIIKFIFIEKDKPRVDADVKFSVNTKKTKKTKKLKNSVDNSIDDSTNVAGNQYNSTYQNYYYGQLQSKELIVHARWFHLIPSKIEQIKNGIDCFNVLKPIDKNYVKPSLDIDFDNSKNINNGVYILVKSNPFIRNLVIRSISFSLDTFSASIDEPQKIFGLLDKDQSFTLSDGSMKIGNGTISLVFGFEYEKRPYMQIFHFIAKNNSAEFVLQQFIEPELDVD